MSLFYNFESQSVRVYVINKSTLSVQPNRLVFVGLPIRSAIFDVYIYYMYCALQRFWLFPG